VPNPSATAIYGVPSADASDEGANIAEIIAKIMTGSKPK
jgi:hypothetical protein